MRWLQAGLLVFETVSRVVRRIGPVEFEPMEKHPAPAGNASTPPLTADPAASYRADAGGGQNEPTEPGKGDDDDDDDDNGSGNGGSNPE